MTSDTQRYYAPTGGHPPQTDLPTDRAVFTEAYAVLPRGTMRDIVTSNLPFAEWAQVFGNERMTGALLDRLTHHCHIVEINGESYRLKEAKRREAKKLKAVDVE